MGAENLIYIIPSASPNTTQGTGEAMAALANQNWAVPARYRATQIASFSTLIFMTTEVKLAQDQGALVLPAATFSWEDNTRFIGQKRKSLCNLSLVTVFSVLKMVSSS